MPPKFSLPRFGFFLRFSLVASQRVPQFLKYLIERFLEDNCLQIAAGLAYTTLLSLVPLMAVIFNIFAVFPAFSNVEADVREFVFSNFVPAAGEVVQTYLQTFTSHTSKLTAVGIAALIVTALLMLRTIDTALNSIWRTHRQRSLFGTFIVYWAVLTLGPLLVGLGIVLTSYLISLPILVESGLNARKYIAIMLPSLSSTVAFTLLYLLIPSRRVPWTTALAGGVLAAVLFEVAKRSFALYITHSEVYQTIYGALATIPIFLLWIYVSWLLILLGAEFTYCLANFNWEDEYSGIHESDSNFLRAYRMLGHLWCAQREGKAISHERIMQLEGWKDEFRTLHLLEILEDAAWVYRNDEELWGVSRDLGETLLVELYRLMSGGLAMLPNHSDPWSENLYPLLSKVNGFSAEILQMPLKKLYAEAGEEERSLPIL